MTQVEASFQRGQRAYVIIGNGIAGCCCMHSWLAYHYPCWNSYHPSIALQTQAVINDLKQRMTSATGGVRMVLTATDL
jgi:hypothetical protein